MKATIKTYQTNASLFVDEEVVRIDWDGMEFDCKAEYQEWIANKMLPAEGCENYEDVKHSLEIATDYLRPSEHPEI